jgi:hypothetical protein
MSEIFYPTRFSVTITNEPRKAKLYLSNDNNLFSKQFISKVATSMLFWWPGACTVIKERRNLLWAFVSAFPVRYASQLRIRSPYLQPESSGILTWFPFARFTEFSLCLGPTNSYMSATRKKTFPTTIFKASRRRSKCGITLAQPVVFRLNNCYYYRDLH